MAKGWHGDSAGHARAARKRGSGSWKKAGTIVAAAEALHKKRVAAKRKVSSSIRSLNAIRRQKSKIKISGKPGSGEHLRSVRNNLDAIIRESESRYKRVKKARTKVRKSQSYKRSLYR